MIDYFKLALSKYADFTGRSRRSEYWYFQLTSMLIFLALIIVGGILTAITESEVPMSIAVILYFILALGLLVPSIAVLVRRLHDSGKSGWYYFMALIPIAGPIILLIQLVKEGEPGANQWGPNPKTGAVAGTASHLVD